MSSFGKATYEDHYNGGMGSNGLTSARHDVFNKVFGQQNILKALTHKFQKDLVYSGKLNLTDPTEVEGVDAGKLVLSPTRTYAPIMKKIFENYKTNSRYYPLQRRCANQSAQFC